MLSPPGPGKATPAVSSIGDVDPREAAEAVPQRAREQVGGVLERAGAVLDPLAGTGLEHADDSPGEQPLRRPAAPGVGDALDASAPGLLYRGMLQCADGGEERPRRGVGADQAQVAVDERPKP